MRLFANSIWGKLAGAIFGYLLAGPLGILIGLFLGNILDRAYGRFQFSNTAKVRVAFFNSLFLTMGYLAKSDGQVTQQELDVARRIMQHLNLTQQHTLDAMRLFNEGKAPGFEITQTLLAFNMACFRSRNLLYMFMQLQLQAAYADGALHPNKLKVLTEVATGIGLTAEEFVQLHRMFQAQNQFHSQYSGQRRQGYSYSQPNAGYRAVDERKNAYAILGLESTATQEEVKKAYRRLMNQYHPDKLAAKGLPEDMMKAATEKVQKIQAAYDLIQKG